MPIRSPRRLLRPLVTDRGRRKPSMVVMVVLMKMMAARGALILRLVADTSFSSSNRSDCANEQEQKDKGLHGLELLKL
jgi:hypothetical protein